MSKEDKEKIQSINKCWICDQLFTEEDKAVRDHNQFIGTIRSSGHQSCNINLRLTKKAPTIFQNLRDCNGHLIMQKIIKFDVEIDVIPNGLEKYMAFTINKNLFLLAACNSWILV